jgi:hypothetical protein
MEQLKITATLCGPLIQNGGQLTFDALLASQTYDLTGDIDQAHNHLPLKQQDGVYYASRMFFEPVSTAGHAIVQNFRPDDIWLDHNLLKKNKHGQVHTKFGNLPDPILNSYRAISVAELTWYATGDADKIRALLNGITHIGKKRSTLVTNWLVESGELDGWHGYADEPLRPVPVALWDGDRSGIRADVAARPAYWNPMNREECFI